MRPHSIFRLPAIQLLILLLVCIFSFDESRQKAFNLFAQRQDEFILLGKKAATKGLPPHFQLDRKAPRFENRHFITKDEFALMMEKPVTDWRLSTLNIRTGIVTGGDIIVWTLMDDGRLMFHNTRNNEYMPGIIISKPY